MSALNSYGLGGVGERQFGTNLSNQVGSGPGLQALKNAGLNNGGYKAKKRSFEPSKRGLAGGIADERPSKKHRPNVSALTLPCDEYCEERKEEYFLNSKKYIGDILKNMWKLEKSDTSKALKNYMDHVQNNISPRMRGILVDWLIEVHNKFKLRPSTMFLTIELLDRFLSRRAIHRTKLQLLGCTCMWIASKYHEIFCPQMSDFVYISDNAFNRQQLLRMETEVCVALDFNLTVPTPQTFMQRFIDVYKFDLPTEGQKERLVKMTQYIVERALMTYDLVGEERSKIAAASLYLAIERLKYGQWNHQIEKVTTYTAEQLGTVVGILRDILAGVRGRSHKAVVQKYSRAKRGMVSKLRGVPNRRQKVRE